MQYEAQGAYSGNQTRKNRSSYRHGFCCPRRRWRLQRVSSQKVNLSKRKAALARSVPPTVHKLPDPARPRKTVVSSRLRLWKHAALNQREPFRVLGVFLDTTTLQLTEVILMNVLGFRRGPSGFQLRPRWSVSSREVCSS